MIPYPKRERTFPPRPGTQSLRVDNLSFPRTSPVSVEMARHQEYLRPRSMPITVPQNPESILRAPFPWSLLVVLYATTRGTAFSWHQSSVDTRKRVIWRILPVGHQPLMG